MSDNKKVFVFGSFTEHEQRSILERRPIKAPQNHKEKSVGSIQFGSSVNTNGELKKDQADGAVKSRPSSSHKEDKKIQSAGSQKGVDKVAKKHSSGVPEHMEVNGIIKEVSERKPLNNGVALKADSIGLEKLFCVSDGESDSLYKASSSNLVTQDYSVNTNGELKKGQVFEIDDVKAWKSVLVSVTCYTLGLFMIAKAPWYLLPLAWAWTGNAITGFLVISHDCAHKSFSKNKFVEDIVGTLAFLPLVYPYEPWPFKRDRHHAKTNMLVQDTAWRPVPPEEFDSSPTLRKAIVFGYGPIRPWLSIAHWANWHFNLRKFRAGEVSRVKISLACVFAAVGWPLIIYKVGILGWVKFWLMPWFIIFL